jgi:hypothetical protein
MVGTPTYFLSPLYLHDLPFALCPVPFALFQKDTDVFSKSALTQSVSRFLLKSRLPFLL